MCSNFGSTLPFGLARQPRDRVAAGSSRAFISSARWRLLMALAHAWLHGKRGSMAPIEQAKLWALRVVLRKQGEDEEQFAWMASQVQLVGGGHPGRNAVRMFFERVDADEAWHPGKRGDVGRPKAPPPGGAGRCRWCIAIGHRARPARIPYDRIKHPVLRVRTSRDRSVDTQDSSSNA